MKKSYFEQFYDPEDKDFEGLLKRIFGKGDPEKRYKYRFLNPNYTSGLFGSYKQEVIFKIITKGSGKGHLSILMNYLSRDLESQKNEEKSILFDHEDNPIDSDDYSKIIDEWSMDFEPEAQQNDPLIDDALVALDKLETALDGKLYDSFLDENEGKAHAHIKNLKESKFDDDKNNLQTDENKVDGIVKVKEGDFCYFEENHKFGVVINTEEGKPPLFVYADESLKIQKMPVLMKGVVKPLNKDIQKVLAKKANDFSHIVLSAGGDNPNPDLTQKATKQFLEENFKAKGFEYMYTTHNDTKNLHTHVVLNNYNKFNDQKLSVNKFELQELRENYKDQLDKFGIDRTATYKKDRENYLETLKNEAQNVKSVTSQHMKTRMENIEEHDFDLLKFRRKSIEKIDKLTIKLYDNGERKLANELLKERHKYKNVKAEDVEKLIENAVEKVRKEKPKLEGYIKKNLSKELGKPEDAAKRDVEIKDEVLEKYQEDLEKTKEDIEKLCTYPKITANVVKQQDKAIQYLDKRIQAVYKKRGIEHERGRER